MQWNFDIRPAGLMVPSGRSCSSVKVNDPFLLYGSKILPEAGMDIVEVQARMDQLFPGPRLRSAVDK